MKRKFALVSTLVVLGIGSMIACGDGDAEGDEPRLGGNRRDGGGGRPSSSGNGESSSGEPDDRDGAAGSSSGGSSSGETSSSGGPGDDGGASSSGGSSGITALERLYFFGDFDTNGTESLGYRDDDAAANQLVALQGRVTAWAVAADGRTAVASTRDDTHFLHLGDAAGQNLQPLPLPAGGSVQRLAFSPDGTKLAYFFDPGDDGVDLDVRVLTLAGNVDSNVTPARAGSGDRSAEALAWSPDSKYLAFTGDFTTDNKLVVYTVDLSQAAPGPVAAYTDAAVTGSGARGATQQIAWASPTKLVFKFSSSTGTILSAVTAGQAVVPAAIPGTPSGSGDSVFAWGVSPDGSKLAYSAGSSIGGTHQLFVIDTAGGDADDLFTDAGYAAPAGRNTRAASAIAWSPDGTRLAVSANWASSAASVYTPHIWTLGQSTSPASTAESAAPTTHTVLWKPDGSALAFVAGNAGGGSTGLFKVSTAANAQPTEILAYAANSGRSVFADAWQAPRVVWLP